MAKVLDDSEVKRLVRRHCSEAEKTVFNQAMQKAPHVVAATVNFCMASRNNISEDVVVKELRRAIRLLKQGGSS